VLLLTDRVDEWLVSPPERCTRASRCNRSPRSIWDLGKLAGERPRRAQEATKRHGDCWGRMKAVLGGRQGLRGQRPADESPACLVVEQHEMSQNLARC